MHAKARQTLSPPFRPKGQGLRCLLDRLKGLSAHFSLGSWIAPATIQYPNLFGFTTCAAEPKLEKLWHLCHSASTQAPVHD